MYLLICIKWNNAKIAMHPFTVHDLQSQGEVFKHLNDKALFEGLNNTQKFVSCKNILPTTVMFLLRVFDYIKKSLWLVLLQSKFHGLS